MFTQFFGNYLLHQQLVSPEHLSEVLQSMKTTRLKLGVLAINAGLMTAAQVERAHDEQQRVDKRIGDVMVDLGFLTKEQVETLLKTQPAGHLLLGQALVDSGYMTTTQFEQALNSYKQENSISESDFAAESDEASTRLVKHFYNFGATGNSEYITSYVSMLFKNLIRFIGDDFTPMNACAAEGTLANCVVQRIEGALSAITIVDADTSAMIEFASRFAKENITEADEYMQACVSEFINLHNGLFAVNMSNDHGVELKLEPQCYYDSMDISALANACVIPVCFSFGTVNFIISL